MFVCIVVSADGQDHFLCRRLLLQFFAILVIEYLLFTNVWRAQACTLEQSVTTIGTVSASRTRHWHAMCVFVIVKHEAQLSPSTAQGDVTLEKLYQLTGAARPGTRFDIHIASSVLKAYRDPVENWITRP